MKSAFALTILLPAISFAGTCYKATTPVPYFVPAKICLEKIVETTTVNELVVLATSEEIPATLSITSTSRHNEDRVNFKAKATMLDIWNSGCGDGILTTINVKGEIAYGEINVKYLDISVDAETTNDTCHSHPQLETYKYIAE